MSELSLFCKSFVKISENSRKCFYENGPWFEEFTESRIETRDIGKSYTAISLFILFILLLLFLYPSILKCPICPSQDHRHLPMLQNSTLHFIEPNVGRRNVCGELDRNHKGQIKFLVTSHVSCDLPHLRDYFSL